MELDRRDRSFKKSFFAKHAIIMKLLTLILSVALCSSFLTKLPDRQRDYASYIGKNVGGTNHFSTTSINANNNKRGSYIRDTSHDNSTVDEKAVLELLSQRKAAKRKRDFVKVNSITYELLNSYTVGVNHYTGIWRTGFTGGHDYTKSADSDDPNHSNLTQQEIDDLIARRMRAYAEQNMDTANKIRCDLLESSIIVDDKIREWKFCSSGHDYKEATTNSDDLNTSNLSQQEIDDLIARRMRANLAKEFDTADKIQFDLLESSIFLDDYLREWRYLSKGHDYKKAIDSDDLSTSNLSQQEIDDLLARRMRALFSSEFDTANKIKVDLLESSIFFDDELREWRYLSKGHSYTQSTDSDSNTSNLDEQEIEEIDDLIAQRLKAKLRKKFNVADSIAFELLKSYEINLDDKTNTWSTGFTKGHFYTKAADSDPNTSNLSEQKIDDLISRRMRARNDRKFDLADRIQCELLESSIIVNDKSREWRFYSSGHDYKESPNSSPIKSDLSQQEIDHLIAQRMRAQIEKKFDVADGIQADLEKSGIFVDDRSKQWNHIIRKKKPVDEGL